MLLAEIEILHSRRIAPTRRVALGDLWLPVDPSPGYGGILLAMLVGKYARGLPEDSDGEDLLSLIDDLEKDRPIPQPRLRHRFQTDSMGLESSTFRLINDDHSLVFQSEMRGTESQAVLGAVYAASQLPQEFRSDVFGLIKRAVHFVGTSEEALLRAITNNTFAEFSHRVRPGEPKWAKAILGFEESYEPTRSEVLKQFRKLIRGAHPDHGGERVVAGVRVGDLLRAKRILLSYAV